MRFLIDAQLSPALAVQLRALGHDAVHVTDILPANAPDTALLSHAAADAMAIVSKDADFVQLAAQARQPVQLVWVRMGNCSTATLVERFMGNLDQIMQALAGCNQVVELR
jgi:predicted nuclease of predicted toxin-antitoxin system